MAVLIIRPPRRWSIASDSLVEKRRVGVVRHKLLTAIHPRNNLHNMKIHKQRQRNNLILVNQIHFLKIRKKISKLQISHTILCENKENLEIQPKIEHRISNQNKPWEGEGEEACPRSSEDVSSGVCPCSCVEILWSSVSPFFSDSKKTNLQRGNITSWRRFGGENWKWNGEFGRNWWKHRDPETLIWSRSDDNLGRR